MVIKAITKNVVSDILKETCMLGYKPSDILIDPKHDSGATIKSCVVDKAQYQRFVCKLIYLSNTRPDIALVASASQFMHSPCAILMESFKNPTILKITLEKGLLLLKNLLLHVEAYMDANCAGLIDNSRSTYGYCTFIGGNLITWRIKKQSMVASSNAKAKFRTT